jgi:hypothetical protein
MNHSIAATCAGIALLATSVAAAPLAPTTASKAVVLRQSGNVTNCQGGGGRDLDTQVLPDASVVPYVPPPGQALVITGLDWSTTGGTAGQYTPVRLRLRGTHLHQPVVFAAGAVADTAGNTEGTALVPNVTVAPGVTVCAASSGDGQFIVHGFHTVNK